MQHTLLPFLALAMLVVSLCCACCGEDIADAQLALARRHPEAALAAPSGVKVTRVGYCGGTVEDPTYRKVCGDPAYSDWAECVQVEFNDAELSYEELCCVFFKSHEPSMGSPKRQYMSAVFAHSEEQYETARHVLHSVKQSKKSVSTKVSMPSLSLFLRAPCASVTPSTKLCFLGVSECWGMV